SRLYVSERIVFLYRRQCKWFIRDRLVRGKRVCDVESRVHIWGSFGSLQHELLQSTPEQRMGSVCQSVGLFKWIARYSELRPADLSSSDLQHRRIHESNYYLDVLDLQLNDFLLN